MRKTEIPVKDPLLFPVPTVLVSCRDAGGRDNIITLAWAGVASSQPPTLALGIRPGRFSYPMIRETGEFVVNIPGTEILEAVDRCGTVSGKNVDKFEAFGLSRQEASAVRAPLIAECPLNLECILKQVIPLGSHDLFIGEIVRAHVSEECVGPDGRIMVEKLGPIAYAAGGYYGIAAQITTMGFAARKARK